MASTVNQATQALLRSQGFASVSTAVGLIAALLLLVLLGEKELLRAHGGLRTQRGAEMLNIAIAPLLVVCAVALTERVISLMVGIR